MSKKEDLKKEKAQERNDSSKNADKNPQSHGELTLPADEIKDLREKAAEFDYLENKHLRACAEFDNIRKRWNKERVDLIRFANYSLIRDLIVIVDELEHALCAVREHEPGSEINKGIEITYNNLLKILKKEGLKSIQAKGKKFDPHFHEIVGQKEDPDSEEHAVLEEVQKGYLLDDKVLRTSKVILAVKRIPEESIEENQQTRGDDEQPVDDIRQDEDEG